MGWYDLVQEIIGRLRFIQTAGNGFDAGKGHITPGGPLVRFQRYPPGQRLYGDFHRSTLALGNRELDFTSQHVVFSDCRLFDHKSSEREPLRVEQLSAPRVRQQWRWVLKLQVRLVSEGLCPLR